MASEKTTVEIVPFPTEKQKKLYDIICSAFAEELKVSNCFILPLINQRVGTILKENGFEKANRVTFLSAPEFFLVGYNKKNADAISLIGFPEDDSFSSERNSEYIPAVKRESVELSSEQQKKLAQIILEIFKNKHRNGKVYLSEIGLKAGGKISAAGLGRVSVELFKSASLFFNVVQDTKGVYLISFKDNCGISFFENRERFSSSNKKTGIRRTSFEESLYTQLMKRFKTNDVSLGNIALYLEANRIVLPESIGSLQRLFELLSEKHGAIIRDNGEGTPKENYLILRKPLPIPNDVYQRVEKIVADFFLTSELIPNTDIGQALKSNSIDFKEYNYADLTAFLRAFSDIFIIVPRPSEIKGRFKIFIRIVPNFLNEHKKTADTASAETISVDKSLFTKMILDLYSVGQYQTVLEQSNLREAIKHTDGNLWNCIFKSYFQLNKKVDIENWNLTEWERAVIDFDNLSASISDEYLSCHGIDVLSYDRIKSYVADYSHKTVNYSMMGQRMSALCGADNPLVEAIYNIGLLARINVDKTFCFRLLIIYYSRVNPSKVIPTWETYADGCINPSSMIMIAGTLFGEGKIELVSQLVKLFETTREVSGVVQLYNTYASRILQKDNAELPSLSIIENSRALELVSVVLKQSISSKNVDLFVEMLYCCLASPSKYVSAHSLNSLLNDEESFIRNIASDLLIGAKTKDIKYWTVLSFFVSFGMIDSSPEWMELNASFRNELISRINTCPLDEKEKTISYALEYYPADSYFVESMVSHIKETEGDGDSLEPVVNGLIASGKYRQVISLHEHENALKLDDKNWFLNCLGFCYRQEGDAKKSLETEMVMIALKIREGNSVEDSLSQLVEILYQGFISMSIISLDSETAERVSHLFDHYKCTDVLAHKYCIAMMGLALCTQNYPQLSLLSCVCEHQNDYESSFIDLCEQEIQEKSQSYYSRFNDLQRTYEYVLTQESPKDFFMSLGRAANVVRHLADNSLYSQIRNVSVDQLEPRKIVILLISGYKEARAWKFLSQYSIKSQKHTLNFVANLVWLFRFKDTSYALNNCIRALNRTIDTSLPRNFIQLCLTAWHANLGETLSSFQSSFLDHVIRCESFSGLSAENSTTIYSTLRSKDKPTINDLLLAIELARQTKTYNDFCELFLKDSDQYLELMKKDVGAFIRFCAGFAYSSDAETLIRWQELVKQIRNEVGTHNLNSKDKSAFLWADALLSQEGVFNYGGSFAEASMELLYHYPYAPKNDIVSKWITNEPARNLPNYELLRFWINTFGDINTVSFAENAIRNYTNKHPISSAMPNRESVYRLRLFLAEKYVYYYQSGNQNTRNDFLRRCMTYSALRTLAGEANSIPASIREKMQRELERTNDYSSFLSFEESVYRIINSDGKVDIKEVLIYCGISNYWDIALNEWLDETIELKPMISAMGYFFNAIDIRPLRRRLLQMYAYSSIAQILLEDNTIEAASFQQKDIKYYQRQIESGVLQMDDFRTKLYELISILQPTLLPLVDSIEGVYDIAVKATKIQGIIFALVNKDLKIMRSRLSSVEARILSDTVLPTVAVIQYPEDICGLLLQMSLNMEDPIGTLLSSKAIEERVGRSNLLLFKCLLSVQRKDFDSATKFLSEINLSKTDYVVLYRELSTAIEKNDVLEIDVEKLHFSTKVQGDIPDFSFIMQAEADSDSFSQLVTDFYTEGLYDSKEKCILARKIYTSIINGTSYGDTTKFMFDWGFVEIEATFDIEEKEKYLLEMLENIEKLPNYSSYKWQFVHHFSYMLQELEFALLFKSFMRIFDCHKILYTKFHPYENCDCYAQLFVLLRRLVNLGQDNIGSDQTMSVIDQIKAQVIEVHLKYPQNRFANSCIGYIDRYAQQIQARGIFEVKILNHSQQFTDVIYYSVRNVGFELATDVILTFSIANHPDATQQISTKSLIAAGLRTNQVFAGEYIPNTRFSQGEVIECGITVEYQSIDEDGEPRLKNYAALDPHTSGRLQHVATENYCYHKDGSAGYITESITQPFDFIGRKDELNRILGKAIQGQNVLLYGTNGTGKSSILQYIFSKALPDIYSQINSSDGSVTDTRRLGHLFMATPLKFDDDCTEKAVISSIISAISDDLRFRAFLKRYGDQFAVDTVAMVADEWENRREKLFDNEGRCVNTELIRRFISTIDEMLQSSDIDVYILIDQFERIISSPLVDSKHMLFLGDLVRRKIRFIIAGSNYLLEEVSVEKNQTKTETSWPIIFSRGFDQKVKIGNMSKGDFEELIKKKSALNNGEIEYSDDAIEFLWQYTNGHAFYSCLIANRTLDILSERGVRRRYIYSSDVFNAIYLSGKYLTGGKTDREKEKAIKSQIFQDINDNIPIKYVGKSLAHMQSSGERKVSYRKLHDFITLHRPDLLEYYHDALAVLLARDFISYEELEVQGNEVSDSYDPNNILTVREYFFTSDLYLEHFASVFVPELSDEERLALQSKNRSIEELITDLRTRKYTAQDIRRIREEVKDIVGEGGNKYVTIERQYNDQAIDQSVGTQVNMLIHAQTINAFSTLLAGDYTSPEFAQAFASLPGVVAYLGDKHKRVLELQGEINQYLDEEGEIKCDDPTEYDECVHAVEEKYDEIEKIVLPAEEQKVKDITSAITLDDFISVNDETWQELLGISKDDVDRLKSLPSQYSAPLGFAIIIHNVFMRIYKNSQKANNVNETELDFCPVAILYCKVVEAMLKEEHTSIYSECFADQPVDSRKQGAPLFSEVDKNSNMLTIGTYLYFLSTVNVNRIYDKKTYEKLNLMRFIKRPEVKALSTYTSMAPAKWYDHANRLPVIVSTRNKSAHELQPISKDRFDWLIDVLFKQGELLRIWDLSKGK